MDLPYERRCRGCIHPNDREILYRGSLPKKFRVRLLSLNTIVVVLCLTAGAWAPPLVEWLLSW